MAKQNTLKPENLKSEDNTNTKENAKPNDDLSFETKPYTENSVIGGNETSHGVAAHGSANQKAFMIHQLHTSQQAHANQQLAGGSKHNNTIPVHLTPYDHLTPSISNTSTMKNQISATKNHANVINNQRSTCGADGAVCDDLLSNENGDQQTGGSKKNSKKNYKNKKTKKNYKNSKNNKNSRKTKKIKKNKKTKKNKKIKGILKKTKNNKKMKKTNKNNKNKKVRFN